MLSSPTYTSQLRFPGGHLNSIVFLHLLLPQMTEGTFGRQKLLEFALPVFSLALALAAWEAAVRWFAIPPFILPAPSLIATTLMEKPELLRLLQYSALELSADFDPLVRRHLNEFVEVTAHYLEPWIEKGELRCASSKTLIFTLVAIVASYNSIQRVFSAEGLNPRGMFEICSSFCMNDCREAMS